MTQHSPEKSDEEIIDEVRDRLLGGPKKRLEEFAKDIGESYESLMRATKRYIASDGGYYWIKGGKFEGVSIYDRFWPDYELVTNEVVSAELKHSFFSCSC